MYDNISSVKVFMVLTCKQALKHEISLQAETMQSQIDPLLCDNEINMIWLTYSSRFTRLVTLVITMGTTTLRTITTTL
jgi:hypothetical protein